jgi:uncharacterized SAM-binding protein YcdF (DUF218 family)
MFILKKWVSSLFFPLSLVIELLLVGLLWPKKGKKFLIAGIILLYLFSFYPFSFLILWPLERIYDPVQESSIQREINWVVVLDAGSKEGRHLTPENRLNDASLKRLLEAIWLCRHLPQARLILSGGRFEGGTPVARVMQEAALKYGLPPSRLVLEDSSRDTQDEVQLLKKTLGKDPFYLVTSASHMFRSMSMFKKVGTQPIPAPTDFRAVWEPLKVVDFFPQAIDLLDTERAFYEYFGLLWALVRGYL